MKEYFHYSKFIIECGRTISGAGKGAVAPRVLVTSGTGERLRGICVYFLRTKSDIALTSKNIYDVS